MKFTAKELKNKLWETLVALEEKRIDPKNANAMIASAREIIAVVRTEITLVKLAEQTHSNKFLDSN